MCGNVLDRVRMLPWKIRVIYFNVNWRWHLYVQSLDKLMVHCNVALETEHIDGFLSISAEVCVMIKKVLFFLCVEKAAIWAMWECCKQKQGWWVLCSNFHCQLEMAPTSAISCSVDGLALNYGFRDWTYSLFCFRYCRSLPNDHESALLFGPCGHVVNENKVTGLYTRNSL